MNENAFVKQAESIIKKSMMSVAEELRDGGGRYCLTISDFENHKMRLKDESAMPLIIFYSANPFPEVEDEEYMKAVQYCKDLLEELKGKNVDEDENIS